MFWLTHSWEWGSCYLIFSFMCIFHRPLFVLLSFFFWPLCCLSFFELRILITPFGIFNLFLGDCVNVNIILRNVLPFTPSVTAKKKLRYGKHYCLARKLQLHVCNSEREGAPNRGKQPIFNATDHKKHLVI
jgi:hypothetical protein